LLSTASERAPKSATINQRGRSRPNKKDRERRRPCGGDPKAQHRVVSAKQAGGRRSAAVTWPTGAPRTMDLIRIIFAIILPPVGVFLQVGLGGQFWLNILLTLFGYIPGIVHAIWIIARR
jgi:uncharacterized membrane protein YqaE (UPF0057 family)